MHYCKREFQSTVLKDMTTDPNKILKVATGVTIGMDLSMWRCTDL